MNQLSFQNDVVSAPSGFVKTTYTDEKELINNMLFIYNNSLPVDVDPCYSKGNFWKGLPQPKYKFDIAPQSNDTVCASCTALPLKSFSASSVMFDPPFVIGMPSENATKKSIMTGRFSGFRNLEELKDLYTKSILEFSRLLTKGGRVYFKCQDTVTHDRQFLSHVFISNVAIQNGFTVEDIFILVRDRSIMDGKWKKQNHARKTHSFYLVLVKQDIKAEHVFTYSKSA
jgi:hypothetical protein